MMIRLDVTGNGNASWAVATSIDARKWPSMDSGSRPASTSYTHWEWPSGMDLRAGTSWVLEGLYDPFSIIGTDVTVPAGTYGGSEPALALNTNRSSDPSFDGRMQVETGLSGTG